MPARVMELLDDLEARLAKARAELVALRDENRRLKGHLVEHRPDDHTAPAGEPTVETANGPYRGDTAMQETSPNETPRAETAPDEAPQKEPQQAPIPKEQAAAESADAPTPPAPQALLKEWQQRYPAAFAGDRVQPLKVGIHHDLSAREPWSNKLIRRALAGYVNRPRYVKALQEGATRIDLDGNPAGTVDATAASQAQEKSRRKAAENKQSAAGRDGTTRRTEGGRGQKQKKSRANAPVRDKRAADKPRQSAEEKSPQPPQSLEEKLANLQRRFGG